MTGPFIIMCLITSCFQHFGVPWWPRVQMHTVAVHTSTAPPGSCA